MSVIKKCDVESHLAERRRRKSRLYAQASQRKAIRLSKVDPESADPNAGHSVYESPEQPASIGLEALSIVNVSDSSCVVVHAIPKSAQA